MHSVAQEVARAAQLLIDKGRAEAKSLVTPVYNVKGYGARGDGTTDDTKAIKQALADAAADKAQVYVPVGRYLITEELHIPPGVTLAGAGMGATIVVVGDSLNALRLQARSTVRDLSVDGSLSSNGSGVCVFGCDDARIINVESYNNGLHGIALQDATRILVQNVRVMRNGHRGLLMDPKVSYCMVDGVFGEENGMADILIGHGSFRNVVRGLISRNCQNAALWIHNDARENHVSDLMIMNPVSPAPAVILAAHARRNIISDLVAIGSDRSVLFRASDPDVPGYEAGDTCDNLLTGFLIIGTGADGSYGVGFEQVGGSNWVCRRNVIRNGRISGVQDGIRRLTVSAAVDTVISQVEGQDGIASEVLRFGDDLANQRVTEVAGYTPFGSLATDPKHPAVPASGTPVKNPFGVPCAVYVTGMPTGGNVHINGTQVTASGAPNNGNGLHIVGPGQTITLIYSSGTPSWRWFGLM